MTVPNRTVDAERLLEIAEELEEMAFGYFEKAAQLHAEAARNRAVAAALTAPKREDKPEEKMP